MNAVDLQQLVPDPPEELLSWSTLDGAIRHRRQRRMAAATTVTTLVVAAIALGPIVAGHQSPKRTATTAGAHNGLLLFTIRGEKPGRGGVDPSQLATIGPDGSGLRTLTHGRGAVIDASENQARTEIAYVRQTDTNEGDHDQGHFAIWLMRADGSDNHRLIRCNSWCQSLTWSPDGTRLAYALNGIKTVDLTGHVTLVCGKACGANLAQPVWSPDGTKIAFSQEGFIDEDLLTIPPSAIWVAGADGSDPHKLTDLECGRVTCSTDVSPAWSPDGTTIAFARWKSQGGFAILRGPINMPTGVFDVPAVGGKVHRLWKCPVYGCQSTDVAWSPDGTKLAFLSDGPPSSRQLVVLTHEGQPIGIDLKRADLGLPQNAVAPILGFAWAPDSDQLALEIYGSRRANMLWITGQLEPATAVPVTQVGTQTVAPDGPLLWMPAAN